MSVRDELSLLTPRLRRFARALAQASPAPNEAADELVHAIFLRILDCGLSERKSDLILQVFSLLTQLHREGQTAIAAGTAGDHAPSGSFRGDDGLARAGHHTVLPKGLCAALASLRLEEREALLLVALEGFSYAQAARILHISRSNLMGRLGRARARLGEALAETPASAAQRRPAHLRLVK
ncbi:MAG: sigma factor-like helix-turn-helix DNA-binding protein [Methylovirgula sp.]